MGVKLKLAILALLVFALFGWWGWSATCAKRLEVAEARLLADCYKAATPVEVEGLRRGRIGEPGIRLGLAAGHFPACVGYVNALLDDPRRRETTRWWVDEMLHDDEGTVLGMIEGDLDEIKMKTDTKN